MHHKFKTREFERLNFVNNHRSTKVKRMSDVPPPLVPIAPSALLGPQKGKDPNQFVVLIALAFAVIVLLGIGQTSSCAKESAKNGMREFEDKQSAESVDLQSAGDAQKFLDSGRGLLMIHAPWCGHCKHMMPAYDEAAKSIREEHGSVVQLLRIDYNAAGREFLSQHGVSGFPTIFEVKGGTKLPYRGNRTAAALIAAAKNL